ARSGYDVDAMAEFFERMSLAMRGNRGGYSAPDFLQTHPVTTTRISEARARAEQLKKGTRLARTSTPGGERVERIDVDRANLDPAGAATALPDNPLLPANLRLAGDVLSASGPTGQFDWARERLRALSAATPDVAIREYEGLRRSQPKGLSDAQQY
ncbi:MAG TPA: peptidase, partial [Xanthomonadaceae bacterium]|nr:peptidase [Xanthomonadaceae bacterium]